MSGGGSPSSQTVTQTTIPEYLRPQVESMVGKAAGLMEGQLSAGYQPYEGQRVAGFTPMQAQAFQQVAGQQVAPQLTDASNLALGAGQAALGYGQQASGIGQAGMQAAQQTAQQATAGARQYGTQGSQYGLGATGMTGQALDYGRLGAQYAQAGQMTAQEAQRMAEQQADIYGQAGVRAGARGEEIGGQGVAAAQQGFGAQQAYQQMATSPEAMQAYMSPYMQNAVDVQKRQAIRQADIQRQANQAQAVASGAYGGSRQAIVEAELQRNLADKMADIQAMGQQQAFQQAQQAQQFGAGLGIQGLTAGLQGLQTGMQGTGQAMTGAGLGLQGTGQRLAAGQLGLAGTAQGIQGAQTGIQSVGQAGQLFGLGIQGAQTGLQGVGQQIAAGQLAQQGVSNALQGQSLGIAGSQAATGAAGQLGQLGGQQFQQQMAITDALQKYGALQQAQQQQGLDVDYQNYLASQNFPYQQLGFFSDIIRGLPMSQSTQTMYGGQPSAAAQIPGMLMAGAGYFGGRKEGGRIQKYAEGGSVAQEALTLEDARALPSKLRRLSDTQLAAYARSVKDAVTLSSIQSEVQRRAQARQPYNPNAALQPTMADQVAKRAEAASVGMAGGGIVALQAGGTPEMMMGGYQPTAEELSQYQQSPGFIETIGNKISEARAAREAEDEALRAQFLAQNAPHITPREPLLEKGMYRGEVAPTSEMVAESYPVVARPQQKTGIAAAPDAKGEQVNVEGAPPVARTGIAAAAPSGPMSYEQWQQQAAPKGFSESDNAVLNDMRSRIMQKMERAGKQSDRAIYDSMMMAGLAMMSGNSFADGLMKAAQAGGATFMSSKDKASKAMEAAEDAELSFTKYKMALERNDRKESADMFKDYQTHLTKLAEIAGRERVAQIQAGARGGAGGEQGDISNVNRAMTRIQGNPGIRLMMDQLKGGLLTPEQTKRYIDAINQQSRDIYKSFGVEDRFTPMSLPETPEEAKKPGFWDRLIGGGSKAAPAATMPQGFKLLGTE